MSSYYEFHGPVAAGLTEDELDRLADFTADALGPAETARVAQLVASDARWSRAHAQLTAADALVRVDLAAAARATVVMPDDVVLRLDEAFRDLGNVHSNVASFNRARARRERRRQAFVRVAAAAAAVVAVGGGIAVVANQARFASSGGTTAAAPQNDSRAEGGGVPAQGAPSAPPALSSAGPATMRSGINYTPATLGELSAKPLPTAAPPAPGKSNINTAAGDAGAFRDSVPEPLRRLADPSALGACLATVRAIYPGTPTLVDYATFNGSPALVVVVRQATGSTVVAVGPDCGLSGADVKLAVPGN